MGLDWFFIHVMMSKQRQSIPSTKRRSRLRENRGLTLVEILCAAALLTILSLGVCGTLLQLRKYAESNVAQVTAQTIAEGIIEQVQSTTYATVVSNSSIPLLFAGATSANVSSVQTFNLPWASDAVTFTDIGEKVDPSDPTSATLGILLDVNYQVGGVNLRGKKYMKMRVNLQRVPDGTGDNVSVILTYSYQAPGSASFITGEMRTVRSQAPSY
jgi:prepilin-type N-terminal cleavage/methylation domain-containing protein